MVLDVNGPDEATLEVIEEGALLPRSLDEADIAAAPGDCMLLLLPPLAPID